MRDAGREVEEGAEVSEELAEGGECDVGRRGRGGVVVVLGVAGEVPAEDADGGDADDGEGIYEYCGEDFGGASGRGGGGGRGFGVGGEERRGGGDVWAVERGVDDNGWGFAGGKIRETPVVEALEEEGQVGEGVVHGEDYLGGGQLQTALNESRPNVP